MRTKAIKALLSVFLLYHFFTVLLLPIAGSLPGRRLAPLVTTYANQLSMNTTWQFFSPGPSPMFYLEYDVETAANADGVAPEPFLFPSARAPFSWNDGWNRRLYGMRFFALNPERLEKYFAPYLCSLHQEAQAISVQAVFERIEDLDRSEARAQSLWSNDFKDMSERIDLPRQRFRCAGGPA